MSPMARQLRCEFEGAWHHVMTRGFQRQVIFLDDKDKSHFLELLENMVERYNVRIHAYVLMPNHYHLLIETPHANASRALQWLNVSHSVWFNRRHGRSGALFQARYKSVLIEGEGEWALACSVCIHLNPVRVKQLGLDKSGRARENAGVVPNDGKALARARLGQLRGYVWSSYRAYAGVVRAPKWLTCETLLSRMASGQPHRAYRTYMAEQPGASEPEEKPLFSRVPAVGSPAFQSQARKRMLKSPPPASDSLAWKRLLAFSEVMQCVEHLKGEPWPLFVNRHGDWGRDLALYVGRHHCGVTLRELGDSVGASPFAVSQSITRFGRKLSAQPALRKVYAALGKLLTEEKG